MVWKGHKVMNKLKKWFKRQYIKFILGQCKHLCLWCEYKEECFSNFED